MHNAPDFQRINQAALGQLPNILSSWLPGGKHEGREYVRAQPATGRPHPGQFQDQHHDREVERLRVGILIRYDLREIEKFIERRTVRVLPMRHEKKKPEAPSDASGVREKGRRYLDERINNHDETQIAHPVCSVSAPPSSVFPNYDKGV